MSSIGHKIIFMNYNYILQDNYVVEREIGKIYHFTWTFTILKANSLYVETELMSSFQRTKNWILKNYPELLL